MLEIKRVRKNYGNVTALEETSLEVAAGEFVTLLGPSGSGKTTLLNMIAGIVQPSAGSIWIKGRDVTDIPSSARGLGMVFQSYALMPHMTIFQNVAFPLKLRKVGREETKRRVEEVLKLVGLSHTANRKPKQLSGGEQQRISLARCIVYRPDLILMDEPLGALDKNLREQMQVEIKALHEELGITIVYVTHDQEEALSMSDRIVLLNRARIEQVGTPGDIYFRPNSRFAAEFVGQSNIFDVEIRTEKSGTIGQNVVPIARTSLIPGSTVELMVRPERISVTRFADGDRQPGGASARLRGTVKHSRIVGGSTVTQVETSDGIRVTAQEAAGKESASHPVGADVWISWPTEDGHVIE